MGQVPRGRWGLERLLAERIVACLLRLHCLKASYYGKDSMGLELAAHYQRCIDRAQKQYLATIKTLAVVRRLALAVLQVNIPRKQLNLAGEYGPAP